MEKACNCKTCQEKEKFLNNPLYLKAEEMTKEVRRDQILKGFDKYKEPLKSSSWTGKQIIRHAFEENIDQQHYLIATLEIMEKQEKEIEALKASLEYWQAIANGS